jgi:hypothetical protein
MAHKNDEAVIDLINRNWEEIAAFAFECYVYDQRGAITMNEKDVLSGNLDYHFPADGWTNSEFASQVREYDPQNEVIVVVQRPNAELSCLRISTPSGRLAPPAACEELRQNYCSPLDVFQRLLNDRHPEQDQHQPNEHQARLKTATQDFLRALRVNLGKFHATGPRVG